MKNKLLYAFVALFGLFASRQSIAQCVQTAPWTEDFENAGTIPNCWSQGASNSKDWEFSNTGGTDHIGSDGTINGTTNSNNYFAWVDDSSPHVTGTELLSPMIDISGLTIPMLEFYRLSDNEGTSNVDFSVDVWDGAAWNQDIYQSNSNSASESWEQIQISLATLTITGDIQIRFVVDENNGSDFYDDVAIDDVGVIEGPSCPNPSNLNVVSISDTDVELNWTPGNTETMWNIEYGAPGFTQGTGTFLAVTSTTEIVSGLTGNTTYDFYVQADCGGGNESSWWGPLTVTTNCSAVVAPWSEGFENAGSIPDCWSQGASNAKDWEFANTGGFDNIGNDGTIIGSTATNNYFAWVDDSSPHVTGTELLSPMIDVSGLTAPMLEFYKLSDNQGDGNVDFSIDVWDGSAWNNDVYSSTSNSFNGEWEYIFVSLNNLTITGDIQLRLVVDENNGTDISDDIAIDDIGIIETPSCLQPSQLEASNPTGSTIDLTWLVNGSETMWNVEYGAPGFAQGTGTMVSANSSNFTLTGLNGNTCYDVYIQADCGGGDESNWIGPINFCTLIGSVNCISGFNTYIFETEFENGIPATWTNTATANPQWEMGSGQTTSSNTGPDAAFSGTEYLFLETSGGIQGDGDTLNGSADLTTGINEAKMSFYYHMYGLDMGELIVEVSDDGGTTWTTEFTQVGQDQTSVTDSWTGVEIDLTPYLGSVVDYRIIGLRGNGFESDMAIDLFRIETCVSCPLPTDLTVSNINSSSAEIGWTIGNSETEWILEYGMPGFTLGNGMTMVTTNNPETLTGLASNTEYEVYVRAICGPSDTSAYSSPITFFTECVTYLAPFVETFDNGVQPTCWDNESNIISTDEDAFWDFDGGPGYGAANNGRPDGTFAWSDCSTPTPDSVMLTTPNIDLSPLNEPYLEFDWFSNNEDFPGDNVPLIVDVLVNGNWWNIDTLATDSTDWMTVSYDLDSLNGQVVKFRFTTNQTLTTNSAYYNDILLDDVRVDNCNPVPGQDGSMDFCRLDDTLNLNNNIIVQGQSNGRWAFPTDSDLLVDDTMLVVSTLPSASYEAFYIVDGICSDDTTVATINVFPASTAGSNGSLTVCLNEPVNLFDGLNGTVDLGGTWYDPSNDPLPNSQPTASNIPGNYNYDYITSNGVCPADTALVEVVVDGGCDWLSLSEEAMNEISVYPNPAANVINVVNPTNMSALKVEIVDVNGRIVASDDKALENSTEGSIAIDHLETGIYTLRVYGENGQKTFKIVKK